MNFKIDTTGNKLRFLANAIETKHKDRFYQFDNTSCVVGLGIRLGSTGRLQQANAYIDYPLEKFSNKYGVSKDDAAALWAANYDRLRIRIPTPTSASLVTPDLAARVLRKLAAKYDRKKKEAL